MRMNYVVLKSPLTKTKLRWGAVMARIKAEKEHRKLGLLSWVEQWALVPQISQEQQRRHFGNRWCWPEGWFLFLHVVTVVWSLCACSRAECKKQAEIWFLASVCQEGSTLKTTLKPTRMMFRSAPNWLWRTSWSPNRSILWFYISFYASSQSFCGF